MVMKELSRTALDNGAPLNFLTQGFFREILTTGPLRKAVSRGYAKIARLLLDKGADHELRDEEEGHILIIPAMRGFRNVIQVLLEFGADINGGGTSSPLASAIVEGQTEMFFFLLERGADASFLNEISGANTLYWAVRNGYESMVRILHAHGMDFNVPRRSNLLVMEAMKGGHNTVAQALVELGATNLESGALSYAALDRAVCNIRKLVDQGVNVVDLCHMTEEASLSLQTI